MSNKTAPFDAAAYLDDDEVIAAYINEAFATGDAGFIAKCIGDVVRARGVAAVATEAGLTRTSLYKTLSAGGNPELSTLLRVLQVLKLTISATPTKTPA